MGAGASVVTREALVSRGWEGGREGQPAVSTHLTLSSVTLA